MASEYYCKCIPASFEGNAPRDHFIFTRFFPLNGFDNIEAGQIHVELTNGHDYWRSSPQRIAADDLSTAQIQRLRSFLAACTDKFPQAQEDFKYTLSSRNGELLLSIVWKPKGSSRYEKLRLNLEPVTEAASSIASALSELSENLKRLKTARNALQKHKEALQVEFDIAQRLIEQHVEQAAEVEHRLFEGVAALLNAKKRELRVAAGRPEIEEPMEVEVEEEQNEEKEEIEKREEGGGPDEVVFVESGDEYD